MWGDAGVSYKRFLSNGKSPWGPGGSPVTVDIQRVGILRSLRLLTQSPTATFTAGVSLLRDVLGPWNVYKSVVLSPNQQAPILRCSGYGLYLFDIMQNVEGLSATADTVLVTETNADPLANVFSGARVTGNGDWRLYHDLYVAQNIRSLGTEIGLWPLENPAVQLQLEYTPSSVSGASPFQIDSQNNTVALPGLLPYYGDPTSGVTLATPTIDVRRNLWEVPADASDDPPYIYVIQRLEENPQGGNVNGASFVEWKAVPLSGVILRLGILIFDGGATIPTGNGVVEASLANSNSLSVLFGADTQKYSETGQAAHARMQDALGFSPPQGWFMFDFLGPDLTLADVIDTYTTPEVRLDVNLSTPLGAANSFAKIQREMLVPIELTGR